MKIVVVDGPDGLQLDPLKIHFEAIKEITEILSCELYDLKDLFNDVAARDLRGSRRKGGRRKFPIPK